MLPYLERILLGPEGRYAMSILVQQVSNGALTDGSVVFRHNPQ